MTERLFAAIGRADLNENPDFKTNAERIKRRHEVDAIVGGWIKERTLAENIAYFEEAGVTAAPVYDIGQFLEDPHVQERGIVFEAPDDEMGEVPMHPSCPSSAARRGLRSPRRQSSPMRDLHRIGYSTGASALARSVIWHGRLAALVADPARQRS
jgi:formyl-CoA transferase